LFEKIVAKAIDYWTKRAAGYFIARELLKKSL